MKRWEQTPFQKDCLAPLELIGMGRILRSKGRGKQFAT